jgi:beta-lactam-binding protein with PASTA domain
MFSSSNRRKPHILALALFGLVVTGCGSKVPDLTGKTQQDAQEALTKAKLKLGPVTTAGAASGKTPGTVVDQDPKPKSKIPDDKTIAIVLEPGGNATTNSNGDGSSDTFVKVPNLVGMTPAEADGALTAVHLARGAVQTTTSDRPAGKIFDQNPAAGKKVTAGTTVDVKVASAPVPPDTCAPGFVWREASPQDHVCVTPDVRSQTAIQNSLALSRRAGFGPYGPDTCLQGFVWRDAFPGDHVCVEGSVRDQAANDNRLAASRLAH